MRGFRSFLVVGHLVLLGPSCSSTSKNEPQGLLYSSQDKLIWPIRNPDVSSHFGRRGGRIHRGLDIRAPKGTTIRAAASGRVVRAGWQNGYGLTVVIRHRVFTTLYAHCSRILIKDGQWVKKGAPIALVGSTGRATGSHLHFEVRTRRWTALNPLDYLPL